MGGYRVEVVWRVLRESGAQYEAAHSGENIAAWSRVEREQLHIATISWRGRGGQLLFGSEVLELAKGLRLDPEAVLRRIEELGGLWRDPRIREGGAAYLQADELVNVDLESRDYMGSRAFA